MTSNTETESPGIPVAERLPEFDIEVLVAYPLGKDSKMYWDNAMLYTITKSKSGEHPSWLYMEYNPITVTHWMPVPPPPVKET